MQPFVAAAAKQMDAALPAHCTLLMYLQSSQPFAAIMPAAARPVALVGAQSILYVLKIPQHASPGPVKPSAHSLLKAVQLSHQFGCLATTSLKLLCQTQTLYSNTLCCQYSNSFATMQLSTELSLRVCHVPPAVNRFLQLADVMRRHYQNDHDEEDSGETPPQQARAAGECLEAGLDEASQFPGLCLCTRDVLLLDGFAQQESTQPWSTVEDL